MCSDKGICLNNEAKDYRRNYLECYLFIPKATRRKIVEVILLNFRSNLGHKDKLEVI